MKRFIASLVLCGVLLSSCTVTQEVSMKDDFTKAFVGLKHHEIIDIMGAPSRETADGLGGTILIYEDISYESISSHFRLTPAIGVSNGDITRSISYIHPYIDKNGVCYKIDTNYTKTVEDESASLASSIVGGVLGTIALVAATIVLALSIQ